MERRSGLLETADITRIIPAWVCDRRTSRRASTPAITGDPHLRLQVVRDEGNALAVEVAQGVPVARDSTLHLQDRGVFQVVAVLRRQGIGGPRLYLRLRAPSR